MFVEFLPCFLDKETKQDCLQEPEAQEWLQQNVVSVKVFQTRTILDFSKKEDYMLRSLEYFSYDTMHSNAIVERQTSVRLYHTTMEDSVLDPFGFQATELDYIQRGNDRVDYRPSGNFSGYWHTFSLDVERQQQKRVRYGYWSALGDIGGFIEALKLLAGIFMTPFVAKLFAMDVSDDIECERN